MFGFSLLDHNICVDGRPRLGVTARDRTKTFDKMDGKTSRLPSSWPRRERSSVLASSMMLRHSPMPILAAMWMISISVDYLPIKCMFSTSGRGLHVYSSKLANSRVTKLTLRMNIMVLYSKHDIEEYIKRAFWQTFRLHSDELGLTLKRAPHVCVLLKMSLIST